MVSDLAEYDVLNAWRVRYLHDWVNIALEGLPQENDLARRCLKGTRMTWTTATEDQVSSGAGIFRPCWLFVYTMPSSGQHNVMLQMATEGCAAKLERLTPIVHQDLV